MDDALNIRKCVRSLGDFFVKSFSFQPPLRIDSFQTRVCLAEKNAFMTKVVKRLLISLLYKFLFLMTFSTPANRRPNYS